MILHVLCEMRKNVKMPGYIAIEGQNKMTLKEPDGKTIDSYTSDVLWCGSGSPFPTPPGGPWKAKYNSKHTNFRRCFEIDSERESEIFIHFAKKKSYGCFIINPSTRGNLFFDELEKCRDDLQVIQHMPIDNRTDAEKAEHPVDYSKMTKKIV